MILSLVTFIAVQLRLVTDGRTDRQMRQIQLSATEVPQHTGAGPQAVIRETTYDDGHWATQGHSAHQFLPCELC